MKKKSRIKFTILSLFILILLLISLGLIAGMYARYKLAQQYPPPGRMVDIGGYHLHLHCLGKGHPTVIMDSGLNEFSVQWYKIQKPLSENTRACTYDRAGLGWSEVSSNNRTSSSIVDELHILLQKAGLP